MEIWKSVTNGQTPSADEDHVLWLKDPEQLQNGAHGEIERHVWVNDKDQILRNKWTINIWSADHNILILILPVKFLTNPANRHRTTHRQTGVTLTYSPCKLAGGGNKKCIGYWLNYRLWQRWQTKADTTLYMSGCFTIPDCSMFSVEKLRVTNVRAKAFSPSVVWIKGIFMNNFHL